MRFYNNYLQFPDLVMEIIEYFALDGALKEKSVLKLCEKKAEPHENGKGCKYTVQPQLIVDICEVLCKPTL